MMRLHDEHPLRRWLICLAISLLAAGAVIGGGRVRGIDVPLMILNLGVLRFVLQIQAGGGSDRCADGGDVYIRVDRFVGMRSGLVNVETLGSGLGGNAVVDAQSLLLESNAQILSDSTGSGNGGTLLVNAGGLLHLESGASITASASQATGGDVYVRSGRTILLNDASITTNAAQDGGTISLLAPYIIRLQDSSKVATDSGGANGGRITIDPLKFALNNSVIQANGNKLGGKVSINADKLTGVAIGTDVTATGGTPALAGSIVAVPEQLDIVGSLVALQTNLAPQITLVPQCGVGLGENQSTFTLTGRGGVPAEPGGWAPEIVLELTDKRAHGGGK
jgi:hypothetical protein